MKKTITAEVDINIAADDIKDYIEQADPLFKLVVLRATLVGFTDKDLALAKQTIPNSMKDLVKDLKKFCHDHDQPL